MYNDEVIIPALQNRGISLRDARDYCIIGCVEPQAPHRTEGWHDAAFFNVAKVLEITLNNGRVGNKQLGPVTGELTQFTSMEDFYTAFRNRWRTSFINWLKPVTAWILPTANAARCRSYQHWSTTVSAVVNLSGRRGDLQLYWAASIRRSRYRRLRLCHPETGIRRS